MSKTFKIDQQVVLWGGIIPLWPAIVLMASLVLNRQLLQLNYSSPRRDKFQIPTFKSSRQTKMRTWTHRIYLEAVFLHFTFLFKVIDSLKSTSTIDKKMMTSEGSADNSVKCFRVNSEKEKRHPMWLIEVSMMITFDDHIWSRSASWWHL